MAAPGRQRSNHPAAGRPQHPTFRSHPRDAKHRFASHERAATDGSPGPSAKQPPPGRTPETTNIPKQKREAKSVHRASPTPHPPGRRYRKQAPLRRSRTRSTAPRGASGPSADPPTAPGPLPPKQSSPKPPNAQPVFVNTCFVSPLTKDKSIHMIPKIRPRRDGLLHEVKAQ